MVGTILVLDVEHGFVAVRNCLYAVDLDLNGTLIVVMAIPQGSSLQYILYCILVDVLY